eukprot:TRINITY_DN667_c3_g1_i1.p1 TRINITY_DN667_c3_g1~~TRINITY_DN667_c3_g1_i1.p1  ORF type:complete len:216 (+),score=16.49 TRINITY_DN667_c3_g1_i1:59-706(+)
MALRRCGVRLTDKSHPKELPIDVSGTLGLNSRFNESPQWNFWSPVWGGNAHALFEEEYFTRREMSNNYRLYKGHQGQGHVNTSPKRIKRQLNGGSNPDMMWAARQTEASAIEVEATVVTCYGYGTSMNGYFTTLKTQSGGSERIKRHHASWIFVPPDRTATCGYCRVVFKRKPGWSPGFDTNLLPTTGVQPTNTSLDPCLMGNRDGKAVPGAVKI